MIRYKYIENIVLNIYKQLPHISFPLQLKDIIALMPNCRYLSYADFAAINNCSTDKVIEICESVSGCSQYDVHNNRYLIICNEDTNIFGNTIPRQKWTCAHEIGHILCNHFAISTLQLMSENSFMQQSNRELEQEADFFASTLLAPFPLFETLNIESPTDIRIHFGLSKKAAENQYNSYIRWKTYKMNPAWINDIRNLYISSHRCPAQ